MTIGELFYDEVESDAETGSWIYALLTLPALIMAIRMLRNRGSLYSLTECFRGFSIVYMVLYLAATIALHIQLMESFDCNQSFDFEYLEEVKDYMCGATDVDTGEHYIIAVIINYLFSFSFFYFWYAKYT